VFVFAEGERLNNHESTLMDLKWLEKKTVIQLPAREL